jgi:gamma-glutamyl phosphate reductase
VTWLLALAVGGTPGVYGVRVMATVADAIQEVIAELDAASQKLVEVCERVENDVRLYDRLERTQRRLSETVVVLRKIAVDAAAGDPGGGGDHAPD